MSSKRRPSSYANPNGQWEVGYSPSVYDLESSFMPYNVSATLFGPEKPLNCLLTNRGDFPNFCQNIGEFPVQGVEPGQVALHPFAGHYTYSIIRFKAPKAATYEIDAKFVSGQSGFTVAMIYRAGTLVTNLGDTPAAYSVRMYLMPGTNLDFVVGPGRDGFGNDMTPVDITIRDVRCTGSTG